MSLEWWSFAFTHLLTVSMQLSVSERFVIYTRSTVQTDKGVVRRERSHKGYRCSTPATRQQPQTSGQWERRVRWLLPACKWDIVASILTPRHVQTIHFSFVRFSEKSFLFPASNSSYRVVIICHSATDVARGRRHVEFKRCGSGRLIISLSPSTFFLLPRHAFLFNESTAQCVAKFGGHRVEQSSSLRQGIKALTWTLLLWMLFQFIS